MIVTRGQLQFRKAFKGADDGAVLVVNGNRVDANRNFISGLVVQEPDPFGGVRRLDGAGDRAVFLAEFTAGLIAVQQSFGDAGVADDFVAKMAGDTLGAVAPKDNFLLHIDDAQAGGQAIKNAATDIGVVK